MHNMKAKTILFAMAFALPLVLAASCGSNGKSCAGKLYSTTFSNPVIGHNCPDPTVLDDRARTGYFYAYSTSNKKTNLPVYCLFIVPRTW